MISKYVFGQPVETGAAVMELPECTQPLSLMQTEQTQEGVRFFCGMDRMDVVYGLGEQMRGINKRGFSYISYATDDPVHTESRHALYGGHNFLILSRRNLPSFGVFVDDPGRVVFDVGETKLDRLEITASCDCVLYVIEGDSLNDIAGQFRKLVGRSYIAPKWAFGYQQSRWGYTNEADVCTVVNGYHGCGIPLDAVYLDIDYMENYKDFTVDRERFPDFAGLVASMKEQGVHLVPIIDAGVKVEPGYPVYDEGVANNYFCKEEDGTDFTGAVWPGRSHFPDVLNSAAREWFGSKYQWLIDQGIDGFWNDMNEPSVFYSEKRLKSIMDEVLSMKEEHPDMHSFWLLKDKLGFSGLCR